MSKKVFQVEYTVKALVFAENEDEARQIAVDGDVVDNDSLWWNDPKNWIVSDFAYLPPRWKMDELIYIPKDFGEDVTVEEALKSSGQMEEMHRRMDQDFSDSRLKNGDQFKVGDRVLYTTIDWDCDDGDCEDDVAEPTVTQEAVIWDINENGDIRVGNVEFDMCKEPDREGAAWSAWVSVEDKLEKAE